MKKNGLATVALCLAILALTLPASAAPQPSIANSPLGENVQKWYERMDIGMDAASILQFNGTSDSRRTPISSRIRIKADFNIDEGLTMTFRAYASGGRTDIHGDTGAVAPVNDIAMRAEQSAEDANRPPVKADMAFVRYDQPKYAIAAGLMDLGSYEKDGDGFFTNPVSLDEMYAFVSGHFTRDLGANFTEKERYSSLAALVGTWRFDSPLTMRAAITFGDNGNHFFVRNTGIVELAYKYSLLGYDDNSLKFDFGFSDADESMTHKMSPSGIISMGQRVSERFRVFAAYSRGEEWRRVSTLFGSVLWHLKGGVTYCSADGDPKTATHYAGIGLSAARSYEERVPEKAMELFWRYKVTKHAFITPDLEVIYNANGSTEAKHEWAILPAIKGTLFF